MLTRRQVARKLGIQPAQVAKLDGAALHPVRNARGFAEYDENQVERLARTWNAPKPRVGYRPSVQERLADSQMRKDVAICISRGYTLAQTLRSLSYESEEIERIYDELIATPEERHQRGLDKIRAEGREKEIREENRARLRFELETLGRGIVRKSV